ncbi:MAG TPA: LanC-like protein [Steroidobacteraceae bacterium]|nr:LanC-like protein [Steroidobacteraceae bacterium]
MLFQPHRHEQLISQSWDEALARKTIEHIARDTQQRFSADSFWPMHPKDAEPSDDPSQPAWPLYFGAAGVIWALHYLQDVGAVEGIGQGNERFREPLEIVRLRNREWLSGIPSDETAAYLMGDTPVLLMQQGSEPSATRGDQLAALIERNLEHPARELMWGSPGTMLGALFLYERFGEERWADLYRQCSSRLWQQLAWSEKHDCRYWTQDLYGQRSTYLDAVHGFVATAFVLIKGKHLLRDEEWQAWQDVITTTIARTAVWEGPAVSWHPQLMHSSHAKPHLMQFCHGSPGFVICLADLPGASLDPILFAAGEATWMAGPLAKGSNLCHGTGGNGYAFLKLYQRTGDAQWLERARSFAMHGISQTQSDEREYGQLRYSLWTGDLGFAIYLWDCIRASPAFPTLDVFYGR